MYKLWSFKTFFPNQGFWDIYGNSQIQNYLIGPIKRLLYSYSIVLDDKVISTYRIKTTSSADDYLLKKNYQL